MIRENGENQVPIRAFVDRIDAIEDTRENRLRALMAFRGKIIEKQFSGSKSKLNNNKKYTKTIFHFLRSGRHGSHHHYFQ